MAAISSELFTAAKLYSLPSKAAALIPEDEEEIVKAVCHGGRQLCYVVLATTYPRLICMCFDQRSGNGQTPLCVKFIPVCKSRGPIKDLCWSDHGVWLLVLLQDKSIVKIPILSTINSHKLVNFDVTTLRCSLLSPTCLTWWTTLDGERNIVIVGNDIGEISFIEIGTNKEIGGTYAPFSIRCMSVIRDKYSVSLLVSCKNQTQHVLTLEETRRRSKAPKSSAEKEEPAGEAAKSYFGCFMSGIEVDSQAYDCWTLKPRLLDFKSPRGKERAEENYILYQFPYVLNVCLPTRGGTKDFLVRVFPCNEFDYKVSCPVASYSVRLSLASPPLDHLILSDRLILLCKSTQCLLLSKEFADSKRKDVSKSLIQEFKLDSKIVYCCKLNPTESEIFLDSYMVVTRQSLFEIRPKFETESSFVSALTDTSNDQIPGSLENMAFMLRLNLNALYEKAADLFLQRRQFARAVRFYQFSKCPQLKRIANFIAHGFFTEVIAYVQVLFSSKNYEIIENDKMHFANIAIHCHVHEILDKGRRHDCPGVKSALKQFLLENQYYDEQVSLRLLIQHNMYDLAYICAKARGSFSTLLCHLLNVRSLTVKAFDVELHDLILKSDFKDAIDERFKSPQYFKALCTPNVVSGLLVNPALLGSTLKLFISILPQLNLDLLLAVASNFNPGRVSSQLLLNNTIDQLRYQYLADSSSEEPVEKKDVLHVFIFVFLMIIREKKLNKTFDERLLYLPERLELRKEDFRAKVDPSTYVLAAGHSHSAAVVSGVIYTWGRSRFGSLGQHPDWHNRQFLAVDTPRALQFFSKNIHSPILSVSCGAQHTLVLTAHACFAFGSSRYGQLGHGKKLLQASSPLIIEKLSAINIHSLHCGQYHSLAVSSDGRLFSWGWGVHGQLGHGNIKNIHCPKLIEALNGKRIVSACGGYCHSLALDADGIVYTFGNGLFGQLGSGSSAKQSLPQALVSLPSPVNMIASNYFHSLALSADGKSVFMWGCNPHVIRLKAVAAKKARAQKKMLEEPQNSFECMFPEAVSTEMIDDTIVKVAAGATHSLLLTRKGRVFVLGKGIDGQLGLGTKKEAKTPMEVVNLSALSIVDIAAGYDFSLAVDTDGIFWAWGQNSTFQLGVIDSLRGPETFTERQSVVTLRSGKRSFVVPCNSRSSIPVPTRIPLPLQLNCDSFSGSITKDSISTAEVADELAYDQCALARVIIAYRQHIDLNIIFKRALKFDNPQIAAVVCELRQETVASLDLHLKALEVVRSNLPESEFRNKVKNVFCHHIKLGYGNVDQSNIIIKAINDFWMSCGSDREAVEDFIIDCYRTEMKDVVFGLLIIHFLQNYEDCNMEFSKSFKLNIVSLTLEYIEQMEPSSFNSGPIMNLVLSARRFFDFPAETLWQSILRSIQKSSEDVTKTTDGAVVVPSSNEMVIFSCNHYFTVPEYNELWARTNGSTEANGDFVSRASNVEQYSSINNCPKCFKG